jgi:hypothetical protein
VAEHADQLRFVAHQHQQAAGDEDEPPGGGEGVGRGIVDDPEPPRQIGALRAGGELSPELLHVALQLGVVDQAELGLGAGCRPPSDVDLLILCHQSKFAVAGYRVHRTGGQQHGNGNG